MFTVENGKLQHGIFQKRNMPIVAIMSTCKEEIKCKGDENLYLLLYCNLKKSLHHYLVHIPPSHLDVWALEVTYQMGVFVILVV